MQEFKFSTSQTERLDEFLRRELPRAVVSIQVLRAYSTTGISNSKIRRLILAGAVQVNGRPVLRPAFELRGHSISQSVGEGRQQLIPLEYWFSQGRLTDVTHSLRI